MHDKTSLALYWIWRQTYQTWIIYRKLRVPTVEGSYFLRYLFKLRPSFPIPRYSLKNLSCHYSRKLIFKIQPFYHCIGLLWSVLVSAWKNVNLHNFLFGTIHRYSTSSSICRTDSSEGLLKVINVSCIRIVIICIQILYTNKTVRLHYRAPTMRNGSGTVIRTIARACPEESISWSHCFLDIVER
jgi:hypothetical protein